jgi:hypothetical protein
MRKGKVTGDARSGGSEKVEKNEKIYIGEMAMASRHGGVEEGFPVVGKSSVYHAIVSPREGKGGYNDVFAET